MVHVVLQMVHVNSMPTEDTKKEEDALGTTKKTKEDIVDQVREQRIHKRNVRLDGLDGPCNAVWATLCLVHVVTDNRKDRRLCTASRNQKTTIVYILIFFCSSSLNPCS